MKKLVLVFVLFSNFIFAQKQGYNWYFGDSAGVTFNTGSPVALLNGALTFPGPQNHNEGISTISDSAGAILCYSDGMTVWNKQHQVMQNGTGLLGNSSTTQSSVIVPSPFNPDRYFYLFTLSSGFCCLGNITDGLRYSLIDICDDSTRGAVMTNYKNIPLMDSVTEKVAVTRHANGTDYWIVTHRYKSNQFWAFHLDATGIADTVITAIGSVYNGSIAGTQGQMKFSPDGQMLVAGSSNGQDLLELFDFDPATGIVSNYRPLVKPNNDQAAIYGVEFSPDKSKLYVRGITSFGLVYIFMVQYDLSAGNLAAINASQVIIDTDAMGLIRPSGLQLGPDGKIYMTSINGIATLAVIQSPNVAGTACNFQDQVVSLGGRNSSYSLPTVIAGYAYTNTKPKCDLNGTAENAAGQKPVVFPNPFTDAVTFRFPQSVHAAQLELTDICGRSIRIITGISGNSFTLQRDELPGGIYFYRIAGEANLYYTGKLIVN